jgi:cytochrome P450
MTDVEADPFERFNRAMGMGKIQDPYPAFAAAREDAGIARADMRLLLGEDAVGAGAVEHEGGPAIYTAYSYEAVQQVLGDGETFSSKMYENVMGVVMGHTILEMDEPEHRRYRTLLQQAFTKKSLEYWEGALVRPVIDRLIDKFVDRGSAELVTELTLPFPVDVIAGLFGIPDEEMKQFHVWTVELISVGLDFNNAVRASNDIRANLKVLLEARKAEGCTGPDLLSILGRAELDGHTLTDDEIFAFCCLLLPAGAETTYRSSSNLLYGLLTHPEQLDAVRNKPETMIPKAMEEGLRWEPPLLTIMRQATKDTEVCGVPIEKGALVITNLGSANHDARRWDNAEEIDVSRDPHQHMAFAFGPHMCLGQHLARMETRVLFEQLFSRLPNLRLDPDREPGPITGLTFRSPTSLPVIWG